MRTLKHVLAITIMMVFASGASFAQRGHRLSGGSDSSKWHPRNERHFDLSDSCWKVFLSELPADTAQMLVGAIDGRRDVEVKIDSLQKDYRAARKAKDTILMRAILAQIKDLTEKIRDDVKTIDLIIDKYHKELIEVRRTCDHDGRHDLELSVAPITPNPATTTAYETYTISEEANVKITIHDQMGKVVKEVFNDLVDDGTHTVTLDLKGLKPGVYLVRLQANNEVNTQKLVIGATN